MIKNRFFTKREKKILAILSGNRCAMCNTPLNNKFHGDHKVPWSKGGPTILKNGQALCGMCNLKKGNKI